MNQEQAKNKQKIVYILYDGRAEYGETDDAQIYCTAGSLKEAKADKRDMFPDAVIFKAFIDSDNVCRREEQVYA